MSRKLKHFTWYNEAQAIAAPPTTDPTAPPPTDAESPQSPSVPPEGPPDDQQPSQEDQPDDVTSDPQAPDMPEEGGNADFVQWKKDFFNLSIIGDIDKLIESIKPMRELAPDALEASQKRFISDNWDVLLIRQDANFAKASKEIRKNIKTSIDQQNPAVSIIQMISQTLAETPMLQEMLVKLIGFGGAKSDIHRKFIAALTGSVVVGGGGSKEDIIFTDSEYSVNISTRFASDFGEINLGKWNLIATDVDRLTDPEQTRLQEGSPEERKALLHRVILESLSDKFEKRAFIMHVVDSHGTAFAVGWDLGDSVLAAYKAGTLIVKTDSDSSENTVQVGKDNTLIPLANIGLFTSVPDGEQDDSGNPSEQEEAFIENRNGILYLTANIDTMNKVGPNLSGMNFSNVPFNGDLKSLMRSVPATIEMISRRS